MAAAPNITFPNRATPGWERYRDAHWEWYQQNHVGPAPTNRKKFWKDIIRPDWDATHAGSNARAEIRAIYNHPNYVPHIAQNPPIAVQPALLANGWSWPPEIPFPPGAIRPNWLQLPNDQALLAAQPTAVQQAVANFARAGANAVAAVAPASHLTSAQILNTMVHSERLAAIRVVSLETQRACQAANSRLEIYRQRDARRRIAFPGLELREAGDDLVPEIRCRSGLRSIARDEPARFGMSPTEDYPGFDTPTGPWTCPGSTDPTSTAQWIPKRELGTGVTAQAILWLKIDEDRVIDRIVTKDIDFGSDWTRRTHWAEDDRITPMEAAVHAAINSEQSQFVVGFRGYRIHRGMQVVRIATEFAYMGDLTDLLPKFRYDHKARDADTWKPAVVQTAPNDVPSAVKPISMFDDSDEDEPSDLPEHDQGKTQKETQTPLPEHFVWLLFQALVEATIHMHRANAIHLDLHAGNIFLAKDYDEVMGGFKIKPLIADFGHALQVRPDRFNNPEDFKLPGKPQTWAPEQIITYPRLVEPPVGAPAIGKHTSVFHLGVLIHFIVNGGVEPAWSDIGHDLKYRANERPAFDPDSIYKYRDKLYHGDAGPEILTEDRYLDQVLLYCHNEENGGGPYYRERLAPFLPLIKQCLSFEPTNRIELDNLLVVIRREIARFADEEVDGTLIRGRLPKRRPSEAFSEDSEVEDEDDQEEDEDPARAQRRPTRRRRRVAP